MSEDTGKTYWQAKIEDLEKSVDNMTGRYEESQKTIFKKLDTVEKIALQIPCNEHANRMERMEKDIDENKNRSHGAELAAREVQNAVKPILNGKKQRGTLFRDAAAAAIGSLVVVFVLFIAAAVYFYLKKGSL